MNIEDLGISEKCLDELRNANITLEEIIQILQKAIGADVIGYFTWSGNCLEETMGRLMQLGLWSYPDDQSMDNTA